MTLGWCLPASCSCVRLAGPSLFTDCARGCGVRWGARSYVQTHAACVCGLRACGEGSRANHVAIKTNMILLGSGPRAPEGFCPSGLTVCAGVAGRGEGGRALTFRHVQRVCGSWRARAENAVGPTMRPLTNGASSGLWAREGFRAREGFARSSLPWTRSVRRSWHARAKNVTKCLLKVKVV